MSADPVAPMTDVVTITLDARARVAAPVYRGDHYIKEDCTMLGRPSRVSGAASQVELLLDDGRSTTAPFGRVVGLNARAKYVLEQGAKPVPAKT